LVNFGFREIQLEERWNPYTRRLEALELTLLVFEGVYKQSERSYFITSERIENPEQCIYLLRQYMKRWGCEDAIRFIKQEFKIEDIRVLKFKSICRLMIFSILAFAFPFELEFYFQKRSRWVLKCLYQWGMEIYDRATFLYYRLHRTLLFLFNFNFVLNNFN
jgi:hypothetical protein